MMKWIEPYSYCSRSKNETFVEPESLIQEIEKRLGGKVVSKRVVNISQTRDQDWTYMEALVEV